MIVTRFAPSPTGYLHIGGARTALFNYLWARHTGGQFLLRIEDTDTERNDPAAARAILDGLKWLGIEWDGEVVYQSKRITRHLGIADFLVREGLAYRCYLTEAEVLARRAEDRRTGKAFRSPYRDGKKGTGSYVVRYKAPDEGFAEIGDIVQGKVSVRNDTLDDFVIVRSNLKPTFLLSCTVDDVDMDVNTVIRGDDHLTNALRQLGLYEALGCVPTFAHVPLILNEQGKPLSKRDGVAGVEDYYKDYLPEAMFNYLLRLGWGHGDDEIISKEQAIDWFDIADVGKAPARIDAKKLLSVNAHYIQNLFGRSRVLMHAAIENPTLDLATEDIQYHPGMNTVLRDPNVFKVMPEVQKRAKTLSDVRTLIDFIGVRPWTYWVIDDRSPDLADHLDGGEWTHDALDSALKSYAETHDLKMRDVCGIVRVALTGMTQHIGVHDLLLMLGREESLLRMRMRGAPKLCVSTAKWPGGPVNV